MLWTHALFIVCLWFSECPTIFHPIEEEALRSFVVLSQEVEEKPEEEPKPTERGTKHKEIVDATQPKHVASTIHPTLPLPPPPLPPLATQNDGGKNILHLDDITMTINSSHPSIAPTPSYYVIQFQHVFQIL